MVKYIYAGFPKCGTKTMARVFTNLGLRVHDFEDSLLYSLDDWLLFCRTRGTSSKSICKDILYRIFKDFDVVTDAPGVLFWNELMEVFPEAKVIFWERDEDQWWKSFERQMNEWTPLIYPYPDLVMETYHFIFNPTRLKFRRLMMELDPLLIGTPCFYKRTFSGKTWQISELHAKRVYRQHCSDVLRNCDKDKILILDSIRDEKGDNMNRPKTQLLTFKCE